MLLFRNQPTAKFSFTPTLNPQSMRKPPSSSSPLELFIIHVEKDFFEINKARLGYSSFSKEE